LSDPTAEPRLNRTAGIVLVVAIFLLAICGLVYELIAGTLSSYLLGDSVTQFSLVIGIFLTAMGVGSYFSQHIRGNLLTWLVGVELAVGVIGGSTALIGFATFSYTDIYEPVLLVLISAVGVLVGLEIPLVIRILRDLSALRVTLANVLSADYLGALAASVLFPFALLPEFGLVRAGLVIGLANVAVAGLILWRIGPRQPPWRRRLAVSVALAAILLGGAAVASGRLVAHFENRIYQDEIIFAETTAHQRMVLTRWREDVRLYLNGHLQFSSVDEYRYHEALVHPAMIAADRRANVLILGGGDGLAARQVLAYPEVERIEIVDIDARVTGLFRSHRLLTALNDNALNDPRVRVHNTDAFRFLQESDALYDVILIDLPDPSAPELGKLYSTAFYGLAGRRLAGRRYAGGAMHQSVPRALRVLVHRTHPPRRSLGAAGRSALRRPTLPHAGAHFRHLGLRARRSRGPPTGHASGHRAHPLPDHRTAAHAVRFSARHGRGAHPDQPARRSGGQPTLPRRVSSIPGLNMI
jgi:spermidine synthase